MCIQTTYVQIIHFFLFLTFSPLLSLFLASFSPSFSFLAFLSCANLSDLHVTHSAFRK